MMDGGGGEGDGGEVNKWREMHTPMVRIGALWGRS